MALRAGYVGVKKSLLGVINSLAGAKVVKSIGDGLKLTAAGKLSADINTETMEFKSGKLSAKATSINYDTDEVATGNKWIDDKDIYVKVLTGVGIGQNQWGAPVDLGVVVDKVIDFHVQSTDGGGAYSPGLASAQVTTETTSSIKFISALTSFTNATVIVYYTK